MLFRRVLIPVVLVLTFILQFLPGTVFAPHPVAALACSDAAQFIADVTIPDGTTIAPGTTFLKTWRLKNVGSCTWTTSYSAVFSSGDQMGAPAVINMPASVDPGGSVNISANMTAPASSGHYRGNWKLRNASGGLFGVGTYGTSIFWVDILVNTTYGTSYDFVANYASATWSSGAGPITPGTDGDPKGFVLFVNSPKLEDGSVNANPGLVVNPQNVAGGYIRGIYPAYTVQVGDRFKSIIDCAYTAPNCYVNFRLNYQIGSGPVHTFWSFNERHEGLYYRVDLDLSPLAGQSVKFILYVADVSGYGTPSGDRAQWVETRIARPGSIPPPPPPPSACNKGAFVSDKTIPDGTVMTPGQTFTKTWTIRNVGTCPWTTSYALVFVFGTPMTSTTVVNLPSSVAPGATADFSVNMVAPTIPGNYRSYWRFQDAGGHQFGVGSGMVTFFADINVSPTANLAISVNDGVPTYTPAGTHLNYTITVTNNGPSDVTGAHFSDTPVVPMVTWSWTCPAVPGNLCLIGTYTTTGVPFQEDVNIKAHTSIVYHVDVGTSLYSGSLTMTASITPPTGVLPAGTITASDTDTNAP